MNTMKADMAVPRHNGASHRRLRFFFNLSRLDFSKNLGVMSFARRLAQYLGRVSDVAVVIPSDVPMCREHFAFLPGAEVLREGGAHFSGIEILAHHFQIPLTGCPRISIFHDLHIFEMAWKYARSKYLLQTFVRNAAASDVLVTEFPRVFFDLPRVVPETTNSLLLISSPPLEVTGFSGDGDLPDGFGSKRFLYYPSQLQEHKNHANLIRALKYLPNEFEDLVLVFTGSEAANNAGWARLQCLAAQEGVGNRVYYLGYVSKAVQERLFHSCLAVACPSLAEGGAYVAIEAILRGKAAIASNIRAILLHLGRYGLEVDQFDPYSPAEIAATITRVIARNSPIQQSSSSLAAINAETWERAASQVLRIAEWLLDGKRDSICKIQRELNVDARHQEDPS
ncbi:MAG: glycosyltransferase [Planctomycetaceae bacterium]